MKPSLDYLNFAFFDTLHSDLYQLEEPAFRQKYPQELIELFAVHLLSDCLMRSGAYSFFSENRASYLQTNISIGLKSLGVSEDVVATFEEMEKIYTSKLSEEEMMEQLDNYSHYIDSEVISKAIERRLVTSHSSFSPFANEEIYVQTTEQIQQFASGFNLQAIAENQFQLVSDEITVNGFLKDNFLKLSCELQACEFWQQVELEQKMERVINSFSFIYKPNPIFITFQNGQLILKLEGSNILLHEVESFFNIANTDIYMISFD
jgi:uncharacterized protein YktA (UPF0223 family)